VWIWNLEGSIVRLLEPGNAFSESCFRAVMLWDCALYRKVLLVLHSECLTAKRKAVYEDISWALWSTQSYPLLKALIVQDSIFGPKRAAVEIEISKDQRRGHFGLPASTTTWPLFVIHTWYPSTQPCLTWFQV
jgi:hypothetical protein